MKYSIIIPTYNRGNILDRCLKRISELEPPQGDWEVIVVNNNSTDNTEEVIEKYKKRLNNLSYYKAHNSGLHVGRNLGLEKSKGDILCYIDDDSFVSKNWLRGIEKAFSILEVVLAGGPCLPLFESKPPSWLNTLWEKNEFGKCLAYLSLVDFGMEERPIPANYIYGCNFCIRRKEVAELGGFHPDGMPQKLIHFRGDGEGYISLAVRNSDKTTLYHPEVLVHHFIPSSRLKKDYFLKRAYNQGISNSYLNFRKQNGLADYYYSKKSVYKKLRSLLRRIIDMMLMKLFSDKMNSLWMLKLSIRKNIKNGFNYHKGKLDVSPSLRNWCLRENYIGKNGEIPQ
jgi:glucosyl-dolichyl phosphate glucuronosyltransferase